MAARELLVVAALLTPVARDGHAAEPAKRPGRFKVGPFYLTPRIELKNAGVDTNVFLTRTGEVPDTSVILSPSVEGVLPVGRRLRLSGRGSVDVNYYRRRGTERSTDPAGEGSFELALRRLVLFGRGGGASGRQRFSIELDHRLPRREKWAAAGLRANLTSKLSLSLSGKGQVFTYGSFDLGGGQDLRDVLDRNTLTATAEARYALTRKTSIVAMADGIEDRFLRPSGFASQKARSYRYVGGLELGARALISGRVLAGFREFPQTSAAGVPAYRGPVLQVDAAMPLFRIAVLKGAAEREIVYSLTPLGNQDARLRNTAVYSRYRGELASETPFDLLASTYLEYLEVRGVFPIIRDDRSIRSVDHVWTVGSSLLRRFGDGVFVGGTLAWSRREGTQPGAAYDRLVYGLQALVTP